MSNTKQNRRKLSAKVLKQRALDIDVEMQEYTLAVNVTKDIERPDRKMLYAIYEKIIERDAHLRSQLRTAHFTVQQSEFQILKNDTENKELKKLFQTSWFTDFITYAIDQEFWGHSLIEFGQIENNIFSNVTLIDRFHVVPEFQKVLLKLSDDVENDGVIYSKNLENWFLIELGQKRDLGLLLTAAIEIIYKKNSRNDWSAFNERFGMPLLSITTDTTNDSELDELENMGENFGNKGYIIGSRETEFDIKQGTGTENGHKKYKEFAIDCDTYISKLINGQTATSDEKSFVGSAEVQERVLNTYTKGRLMRIQRNINDKLIPFLVFHGYPLADTKFQYVDLLKKEAKPIPTPIDKDTEPEKKKHKLNENTNLRGFQNLVGFGNIELSDFYQNIELTDDKFKGIAKKFFDMAAKKIYALAKKNKLSNNDDLIQHGKELMEETAKKLNKAVNLGISSVQYNPSKQYLDKLNKDVWVFSGFKTRRQLKEASNLLKDANGNLKPWNKFRDDILNIHKTYNINYLRAEHNAAVSSSLMAAKWKQFEDAGDRYYLQYRTAGDERVRSSHAAMNLITLPMSDSFWDTYFPPNGWGCRCNVVQVLKSRYEKSDSKKAIQKGDASMIATNKNGEINEKATAANKTWKFNPGKQAAVFPKSHPYYKVQERYEKIKQYAENQYINNRAKYIRQVIKTNIINKGITIKRNDIKELQNKEIIFTNKGIKEALNQPHKYKLQKNEFINDEIIEAIKNAKYVDSILDAKNRFKQFHYLKIEINNEASWIILREKNTGEIDFYTIVDFLKKEK